MAGQRIQRDKDKTLALTILAIGTAVSLASMLGGAWIVRLGIVVAVVMAVTATFVALRQVHRERVVHREEIARQVQLRTQLVEQHHTDSVALIDRFGQRTQNLSTQIATLRRQLGAAKGELSAMRGNSAWLRGELAERQARISALTTRVETLEAQLATNGGEAENVLPLPRHGVAGMQPSVDDIWGSDEHPTMVDLSSLQLDVALEDRKQA